MRSIEEILKTPYEDLTEKEKAIYDHGMKMTVFMNTPREELSDEEKVVYDYMGRARRTPIPVPVLAGDYIHIYKPTGDTYRSAPHPIIDTGSYHKTWVPNDFSIIHHKGCWHMIGITHPRTPHAFFRNEFDRNYGCGHEAEWQLFHAEAQGESFRDVWRDGAFRDRGNILATCDRPDEQNDIWAPSMIAEDADTVALIYAPGSIRRRRTKDFIHWEKAPDLFKSDNPCARDINIFEENGTYYVVYVRDDSVVYRTSRDMISFDEERVLYTCRFKNGDPESPFLIKRDGIYYLFWCLYDGQNGSYDNRTYVFAADTIEGLYDSAPITMLPAHAPELVLDSDGSYYLLSVYYPKNGVSAVKLDFRIREIPEP